ncbi:mitochondrial carrier protein [Nitzschia inconspicua]|uniref:Mitochondrial carrier protein n=1 Tax=Nitzschia inconspicua TaxID=303405 RepID=A0A9K3L0V3_9STRA|nr:mitochondrial carrier protein [Nitzschia inconspicua]
MSVKTQSPVVATAAAAPPSLLTQVGMAGTAAVITVSFIHPIDVVKTRIQISTEYGNLGMGGTVKKVVSDEGFTALWKGVNAAWLREASYTSLRLGLYEPTKVLFGANDKNAPFYKKFAAGSAAGALGSLAGNPFDVLKTKMMASSSREVPSMMATAKDLFANQGISGFYRGIEANIARAMVLNGTKMACYDQAKGYVVDLTGWSKTSLMTQFFSAVTAGFFMTCTVSPFDMIRTRLMNQPADQKIYNNAVDCAWKIATQEGPLTFWRGFMPIWSRFAPTTTLQLIIFEQLRSMMGMKSI